LTLASRRAYLRPMKATLIILVILVVAAALMYAGGRGEPTASGQLPQTDEEQPLSPERLGELIAAGDPDTYLVDVRTAEEYNSGAIPSAINIPYDVIADNLPTEDRSARITLYCRSGSRSSLAAETLEQLGFTNVINFGGVGRWTGELEVRQ
jgi:rhodanese-related sulfurtransferase